MTIYIKSFFFVFLIFWILFYATSFYVNRKSKKDTKIIYECGFEPFNNVSLNLNMSFFISASVVLLYELELLLLIPAMLNHEAITSTEIFLIYLFILFIFLTALADADCKFIKWVY